MRFEEVLPALREGKKIRRKEWEEIEYIYKPKNENELRTEDYHVVNLSWEDFFSDNWEIVKEKKKVKLRDLTEEQYVKWRKNNCCANICVSSCPFKYINCSIGRNNDKEMYSDKFLDQEIEVEE